MNRNVYFTSDWHLGHENSIDFDSRPFRDIEHMHRVLINNYNSTVGIHDVCYFLGDMGFTKGDLIKKVIMRLNGTKILIMGNHDKKGRQFYTGCGFATILYTASIAVQRKTVTMSHCPLRGIKREDVTGMRGAKDGDNWHGESKHNVFSLPDFGQFHLHGHTHKGPSERILDRQWDVGVVGNGYKPVSLRQIESWVAKYGR